MICIVLLTDASFNRRRSDVLPYQVFYNAILWKIGFPVRLRNNDIIVL
jgi:hypothetical protein